MLRRKSARMRAWERELHRERKFKIGRSEEPCPIGARGPYLLLIAFCRSRSAKLTTYIIMALTEDIRLFRSCMARFRTMQFRTTPAMPRAAFRSHAF